MFILVCEKYDVYKIIIMIIKIQIWKLNNDEGLWERWDCLGMIDA